MWQWNKDLTHMTITKPQVKLFAKNRIEKKKLIIKELFWSDYNCLNFTSKKVKWSPKSYRSQCLNRACSPSFLTPKLMFFLPPHAAFPRALYPSLPLSKARAVLSLKKSYDGAGLTSTLLTDTRYYAAMVPEIQTLEEAPVWRTSSWAQCWTQCELGIC